MAESISMLHSFRLHWPVNARIYFTRTFGSSFDHSREFMSPTSSNVVRVKCHVKIRMSANGMTYRGDAGCRKASALLKVYVIFFEFSCRMQG
jgi:hypothetical protein